MKSLDVCQLENVNGGDYDWNHFACDATSALFGACCGAIVGSVSAGAGFFVGWGVGVGLAGWVC